MKKNLFILLACCLYFGLNAQNQRAVNYVTSSFCLPDSASLFVLRSTLDSTYHDKTMRYFYIYDANGNTVNTMVLSKLNDTSWVALSRFMNTYNSNNNLTDSIYQSWNNNTGQWVNFSRQMVSYNPANKPVTIVNQSWLISASAWNIQSQTLNYYNASNLKTASKFQYWDTNNNNWITDDSVHYVYNSGQLVISHQYYKTDYGVMPSVLKFSGKDTLIYNSNNDPVSYLKKTLVTATQLANSDTVSWAYDLSNRLIYKSILNKNGFGQWQNQLTDFYTYDSNNRMIKDSSYYGGGVLKYYTNCAVAGFNEISKERFLISIYPNPVNSSLFISSTIDYTTVKIINVMGQTIYRVESKEDKISVSDLSNGFYFIQILDKDSKILKTEKFIKN